MGEAVSYPEGIDVSSHNGDPTLSGLGFLFARACYATRADTKYARHVARARAAGLRVGAYIFGVGGKQASIASQAATFLRIAKGAHFLALDLETNGIGATMTNAEGAAFIGLVHKAGYKIWLYHSRSGFPELGQDWNWVAQWRTQPPDGIRWRFWQWQGHPLDRNRFNGSDADLRRLAGRATVTAGLIDFGEIAVEGLPGISIDLDSFRPPRAVSITTPAVVAVQPSKEVPPMADERTIAAIETRVRYLRNDAEAGDAAGVRINAAKIVEFAARLLSPTPVVPESTSIYFGTWANAKDGKIDLSTPSRDTFGLLIQWVASGLGWATAPLGSVFAQSGWESQARQLATSILVHGEDYYPVRAYPAIPADVLVALYGISDPDALRAIIEGDPYFSTLRSGGVPYDARPETGG